MRQVPTYLLIGNGRLAQHLQHYFSLLKIPFTTWHRGQKRSKLEQFAAEASHILILISDHAINDFIREHLAHSSAHLIHCSGSLVTPFASGFHPLMTFTPTLYDLETYLSIPFVVDADACPFEAIFPDLPNPHVRLATDLKAKYHAFCVLSGNFSCLLWQKFFATLENEFHLPATLAHPYLLQVANNLIANPQTALSGPLVRADIETLENNLAALANDPYQALYQSFVNCYEQDKGIAGLTTKNG